MLSHTREILIKELGEASLVLLVLEGLNTSASQGHTQAVILMMSDDEMAVWNTGR